MRSIVARVVVYILACASVLGCCWSEENLGIYKGNYNYSTYYVGNSPLIILSQHGGYIEPDNDTIPDRHAGCWNGTHCLWFHNCQDTTPYSQDTSECGVKTLRDSYTKEFAQCLRENMIFNISSTIYYPHLVINELHRIKLDANREFGEATLNNSIAADTYDEIHYQWMSEAKENVTNICNWGLVFDIHGQSQNDYNQLGYRISQSQLLYNDNQLNDEIDSTSIRSLAEYNLNNFNISLSDIIRGNYSLGNYLNQTYGDHLMIPSLLKKNLGDYSENGLWYYQGGFGLETHGSQDGGNIDAIQIEVNYDNRWTQELRIQFCYDFSQSVIAFVNQWYNMSSCSFYQTEGMMTGATTTSTTGDGGGGASSTGVDNTEDVPTASPANEPSQDDDIAVHNNMHFSIVFFVPLILIVTVLDAIVLF